LADRGGFVLLLGVGMRANTAAHIGETMARVHCLGFNQFSRRVRLEDGRVIPAWSVVWRDGPCLIEWEPLEARLRSRGLIRDGRIGDGEAHLMMALDVIETTFAMTQELCPQCPTMPAWSRSRQPERAVPPLIPVLSQRCQGGCQVHVGLAVRFLLGGVNLGRDAASESSRLE
jgi:hypothetical protein